MLLIIVQKKGNLGTSIGIDALIKSCVGYGLKFTDFTYKYLLNLY